MQRKPIFDTVRRLLGRGFRRAEVAAIDAAIDAALTAPDPARAVSRAGRDLVRRWEGCARRRGDGTVEAYPDPGTGGEPWTIGWGSTGGGIGPGTVWTQAQCDARLDADLARAAAQVDAALAGAPTMQAQFDALVSFHYNTGAIAHAALTRLHRAGNHAAAAREFGRWIHAGGRVMPGLVRRRAEEAALYASAQ
ncbi:lysozyme [Parablastomonas sp. CN1-191]|uniref:lysozyme n=1 Tax=Parablastomonas sp. CN1-191 TaxID=3400908 RepID=UPI003BF82E04